MKIDVFQVFTDGFLLFLKFASPALVLLGLVFAIQRFLILREKRELSKSGIDQIDQMSGQAFEKYLEVLFEKLGYRVERTRYIGDYGADLVTRKDGAKTVIQAWLVPEALRPKEGKGAPPLRQRGGEGSRATQPGGVLQ